MKVKAFTLIELLIVVAIIAILAAIAVPNFLEAQVRSKVSRVRSDQRTLATAIESYAVDHNVYPPNDGGGVSSQFRMNRVVCLTTPVAYLTSLPKDPFLPTDNVAPGAALDGFQYFNYDYRYTNPAVVPFYGQQMVLRSWGHQVSNGATTGGFDSGGFFDIKGACIKSFGPAAGKAGITVFGSTDTRGDLGAEWAAYGLRTNPQSVPPTGIDRFYDPTNGTISAGNLVRFVGAVQLPQVN